MMNQIQDMFGQVLHLFSALALLCGVGLLLASLLNMKGPDGYIKGVLLILLAGWIAHPHF